LDPQMFGEEHVEFDWNAWHNDEADAERNGW
jgi:hypothetical protein